MIQGIGIDQIEVERVFQRISNDAFKKKVFTQKEINYCESQGIPAQHYAARFAAKEAFFKALGTGWSGQLEFFEVEILNDQSGKPYIFLHGEAKGIAQEQQVNHIHISLSHLKSVAAAVVILEKKSHII